MGAYKDLTGQRFGKLVVTGTIRKNNKIFRTCKCDCGNTSVVTGGNLTSGGTKTCGCSYKVPWNLLDPGIAQKHNLYNHYKRDAKKRKLYFDLSIKEFTELTSSNCYYCNTLPNNIRKSQNDSGGDYIYNGIDRVNNDVGYTLTNCVPCCKNCNYAKRQMSTDEFKEWIIKIYENYIC